MPKPPVQLLVSHVMDLHRVVDREALQPMRALYEREAATIVRNVAAVARIRGRDATDVATLSALRARAGAGLVELAHRVTTGLVGGARAVMGDSVRALDRLVGRLSGGAAPPDSDLRVQRVVDLRRAQVEGLRARTATHMASVLDARVRDHMTAAIPAALPARVAVERLGDTLDGSWWMVERVVRTETAFAYNAAADAAIGELAATGRRGMLKRWTELVDDATGRPIDNRVAPDSMAMHGQVTAPGAVFTMPSDERVSSKMYGRTWAYPPNRPNDRAVVIPWMPGWDIPGWRLVGGRRVPG